MIHQRARALEAATALVDAARSGRPDPAAEDRLAALDPGALAVALADPADRAAFWINVYNGAVRARLLRDPDAYERRWRFFSAASITVAGTRLSPNDIEHGLLRRSAFALAMGYARNPLPSRFERRHRVRRPDPRVHFALNCGARSCPPLAVYEPGDLDARLDAAAGAYLAAETRRSDAGTEVFVPRILLWYLGDFGGRPGIVRLLRRHGVIEAGANPRVRFRDYDWSLVVPAPPGPLGMTADSPATNP